MPRSKEILSALASLGLLALTAAAAPATSPDQVEICHRAGPTKTITLSVSENAVAQHVAGHGDTVGACGSGGGGDT